MSAWMRCGCGWQGKRDHSLHQPCPACGGEVEFSPVQGALLARVLRERFGPLAAPPIRPPEPLRKRVTRKVADYPGARGPVSSGLPEPAKAKGTTLEELLSEW